MGKRFGSLALTAALIAGVFTALPAKAQTEPGATGGVVPAAPNIVDDASDANAGGLPATFNGADVLAGWFTHDATNVYVHIQVTNSARPEALTFQTTVGPAAGLDCVQLRMVTAGLANDSFSAINVSGDCGDVPTTQYGPLLEEDGPDGTTILTGTFPREGVEVFAEGALLAEPDIIVGMYGHSNPVAGGSRIGAIDDTAVGTDYSVKEAEVKEPKKKPKKAGAKNKKNKKPKKPKVPKAPEETPAPAACAPYVPGDQGAEVETSIVTDAATAEAPLEVTITAPPGVPEVAVGHAFHNIQVDMAGAESGLYVAYEFPVYEDHDIFLNYASGNEAAHTGGFNPAPVPVALGCCDGTGTGGHSEQGAEFLDGVRTADCGGYTLDMASFASEGGDMTLKLWLGEATYDPAPDGGGSAMEMLYRALGL